MRDAHVQHFWKRWLGNKDDQEQVEQTDNDEEDLELQDEGDSERWWGTHRPGMKVSSDEEFADEDPLEDPYAESDHDSDDDDNHGGHMMPAM